MMFGGLAFIVAAADRQRTESIAAAAALVACLLTAAILILGTITSNMSILFNKLDAALSMF